MCEFIEKQFISAKIIHNNHFVTLKATEVNINNIYID